MNSKNETGHPRKTLSVRGANASDAQKIARIHFDIWRMAYRGRIPDAVSDAQSVGGRAAFWRERLAQTSGSVFVAESDEVVGFCELVPSRDKDADPKAVGEIAAIYVLRQHWRGGAGRALCDCGLAEARRRGYETVTLWVSASNHGASRFYEAMGFSLDVATKIEKLADGSNLHEIRFRRRAALTQSEGKQQ